MKSKNPKVCVIEPHGFCSGVTNAVKTARSTLLSAPGERVYCLHQLVHNEIVVNELSRLGMVSVDDLNDVPDFSRVLFSAHGVAPDIRETASKKHLDVIDTTCPFVARVHREAADAAKKGIKTIVIGEAKHIEVKGVVGEISAIGGEYAVVKDSNDVDAVDWDENSKIRYVVQTTLSEDDLEPTIERIRQRFPNAERSVASCVCTATHDRQKAVRDFVKNALKKNEGNVGVLVLGSVRSANTKRLAQIAELSGSTTWRCASLDEVSKIDFSKIDILGITAGASTPESLLDEVLDFLD